MKARYLLLHLLLCAVSFFAQAQQIADPDSLNRKSAIALIEMMRDGKPVDTLSPRVIVLGNEECGHCKDMKQLLTDQGVYFESYDVIKDNRFFYLLVDYFNKVSGGNISISYPAIVANGKIYTKIGDMSAFAQGLKAMQDSLNK